MPFGSFIRDQFQFEQKEIYFVIDYWTIGVLGSSNIIWKYTKMHVKTDTDSDVNVRTYLFRITIN